MGLNPGPPALETSTIPLGYRGGGNLAKSFTMTDVIPKLSLKKELKNALVYRLKLYKV